MDIYENVEKRLLEVPGILKIMKLDLKD